MEYEIKYATERRLDSVWTLAFKQISDSEISIISFDRTNKIGYLKEKELPRLGIIETKDRIAIAVRFTYYTAFTYGCGRNEGKEYKVINPKHIFDYGK